MITRLHLLRLAAASAAAICLAAPALAQDTIKIGELNSYKSQPAFLDPYKKGWELAVEEINAKGGVLGKKLEVISRDDGANPGDAVRVAEELITREGVRAHRRHVPVQHRPRGHRLRQQEEGVLPRRRAAHRQDHLAERQPLHLPPARLAPTCRSAMLVPEAVAAKKKRWALVYPNYEYGQSAAATFKELLKASSPTSSSSPSRRRRSARIEAGAVVQALDDAKPDAIFNVLFGADLPKFVREGNTRGLFKDRTVVSLLTGEPEYLDPLQGRGAGRLDRHRLSLGRDQDAGAQEVLRSPIRASTTTIRGSARWSATRRSCRSPTASRRPARPTPRS